MKIKNKIENFLFDRNYKIIVTDKCINIVNYEEIINFSLTKIEVKYHNTIISIDGADLTINKMLEDEVLISGSISNISINKK